MLELLRSKFSQYQDGPNKVALAHALLGRSMIEIFPIINMTKEQLEAYEQALKDTGADMSGPVLQAFAQTGQHFQMLGLAVEGLSKTFCAALQPAIDLCVRALTGLIEGITQNIREGGNLNTVLAVLVAAFDTLLATITTVVYGLMQLWQIFAGLVQTISAGCKAIIDALVSVATASSHLAKGEFSQILPSLEKPWSEAAANLEAIWTTRLANMQAEGQAFVNNISALFSNLQLSMSKGLTLNFHEGEHTAPDTRPKAPALPGGGSSRAGKGAADQSRLSEWRAELQQRLIAEENYFNDSKKEELAFWQDKLAYTKAGSKEQQEVENEIYRLKKQLAHDAERDAIQEVEFDRKVNDEKFTRAKQFIAAQEEMGKLSATEALRTEEQLLDQKWAADAAYYEKEMAAAEKDAATHKKLDQEMLLAHEKYLTQKQQLELKVAEETAKKEKAIDDEIATSLSNAIMGALSHSQGQTGAQQFAKALGDAIKKYVGDALTSVLKKAFEASPIGQWLSGIGEKISGLFGSATKAVGGAAGNAAGSAALGPAAATLQTGATTLETGATTLQAAATTLQGAATASGAADSASGAGGSAAVVSAIEAEPALAATAMTPILTAALAPVITLLTTMNAEIIALNAKPSILGTSYDSGGVVPSAEGGMVNDGKGGSLAILHPNEMVLPAPLSEGLQRMITTAKGYALPSANINVPSPQPLPPDIAAQLGGAGGGRGMTVVNNNVSAIDAQSVAKFFKGNAASLVAAINHGIRNGSALQVPQ